MSKAINKTATVNLSHRFKRQGPLGFDRISSTIVEDIQRSNRSFLPGTAKDSAALQDHLGDPVLADGLDAEESCLIASTLPAQATDMYVSEMDKGLSGARVLAARFMTADSRMSRSFVIKLGRIDKLEREAANIEQLVCPYVPGVDRPVYRRGLRKALIAQGFVGLHTNGTPVSFRLYSRSHADSGKLVLKLFRDRLGNWYNRTHAGEACIQPLKSLFVPYLKKGGQFLFPRQWNLLKTWVSETTGVPWHNPAAAFAEVIDCKVVSPRTIIHGDLHAQNLLVDEGGEIWPIDFAWTQGNGSPLLDFAMLECSLKFLAIPQRSDLRSLFLLEHQLVNAPIPKITLSAIPYRTEIRNVLNAIIAVRQLACREMRLAFDDYQKALFLMTFSLTSHPKLNRPYVLASLQLLTEAVR